MKSREQLQAERDQITAEMMAMIEEADGTEATEVETRRIAELQARAVAVDSQLIEHSKIVESQRSYNDLVGKFGTRDTTPARTTPVETRSWGDMFVESDQFQSYLGAGTSGRVIVPGGLETRAPITTATLPQPSMVYAATPYSYASPLMSVVGHVTTSFSSVEWIRWSPTPVAAAPIVAEGALKPEMAVTATPQSDTLDTYAHWKEITRQALEDIPQIRTTIENLLRQGIQVALETAVGDKLEADTAIPPATVPLGGSLLEAIRIGVATVQSAGYSNPNAVLINPMDAADIDLGIMNGTSGGPSVNGSLWGMQVIAVPSLTAGTAYVGNFKSGVQVFDRGSTSIYLTDSHADSFIRNILILLAEIRALVAVTAPLAIAKCSVAAAAGTAAKK